ncbi:uncharacterized protein L3040_000758 [Drepanopeziza brunnea f. sp. 'multigermtubi']|uniref:uncharacterized protein n=1 Tax=Drepanopeziza brunnea f. sp. 'multigermtubi' TaxID=698441 RepID=UPI0023A342F2|nr:hypothetical protein L3040_000758 [Drepanopeziza brunnea f. sp. 'multigermtubi']
MAPPPGSIIPPELPPTVEEAYRRKCIELKQRLSEVEQANDSQRIRTDRARRAVQKMRLERSFLLEQLAKRTSTNVEDSDGSPSPPPSPKEKPLRIKRGHRKPDFLHTELGDGRLGSTFAQQGPVTLSPSSDAFSHSQTQPEALRNSTPQASVAPKRPFPTNGTYIAAAPSLNPAPLKARESKDGYDQYRAEIIPTLVPGHPLMQENSSDVEAALARGWSLLDLTQKHEYAQRRQQATRAAEVEREVGISDGAARQTLDGELNREEGDEDVEMAEDSGTPAAADTVGGFTAVNRA